MTIITPRQDIIDEAHDLSDMDIDVLFDADRGNFDEPFSIALQELVMNGLDDDSHSCADGSHFQLIDRWILLTDSQGFVNNREYETDQQALIAFQHLLEDVESQK